MADIRDIWRASLVAAGLAVLLAGTAPAWATGETKRVSVGTGRVQGNAASFLASLSANGRFVVFGSSATNLVAGDTNGLDDVFVRDRRTGTTERVSVGPGGVEGDGIIIAYTPAISHDGRFVVFASDSTNLVVDDTNEAADVFVRDRRTGTTERVSVGPGGVEG